MSEELNTRKLPYTRKNKNKKSITAGTVIRRVLLCVFTFVIFAVVFLITAINVLVNGECEPLRNRLVLSATQASATKWLPGLFMPQETVDKIVSDSYIINTDVMSIEDYYTQDSVQVSQITHDKWENAIDGMILETVTGPTFTGYVLLVKDPSRLYIGTSSDFKNNLMGINIFDMAKKEQPDAIINAGEFADPGGQGTGNNPMGLTYSKGECVWNDGLKRTFIGFDKNNRLVVTESMTKKQADEIGIRDGVSFQNGNTLITNKDGQITIHYSDYNTGTAQRTAIGQSVDGTMILLVTDGRSASSLGATRNDVIDVLMKYNAVVAGMLDGGSSSLMYYEDYFNKYDYDTTKLDEYQKRGLVNRYKAFTNPRRMPTFICVSKELTEEVAQ
ncbi:MAG: phosphodiester glycosidase family protein [Clostridia bacterium]|nr:phosphodiester glycosidase family protein [Clostridia bacterium]